MIEPEEIRRRIIAAMPDAEVTVRDLTGGGDHYEVRVISTAFTGLNPLKRHRLVYEPFRDVLESGVLHAFAVKALTPSEKP